MKRLLRIIIPLVIVVVLIALGALLIKQKKKELGQTRAYGGRPRPVTVATAEKGDLALKKEYLAEVEPARQADISARVTAVIENIRVDEGDRIKADDVLAELDAEEIEHRIDALSFRIEQTRAELAGNRDTVEALRESYDYWQTEKRRTRSLAEKGAISQSEAEQTAQKAADIKGKLSSTKKKTRAIQNQIEALKKQKSELLARRSYYTLTSPFAGVVTRRIADPGDMAAPSKPLLTVQDQSSVKIAFDVPQKDLPRVQEGQTAVFKMDNSTRKARISLLEPTLNKAKMMRAEVWPDRAAAAGLTSGAYLPVTVIVEKLKDVVLLPASAVIEAPKEETHVFALTNNSLSAMPVQILGRAMDRIAVKGIDSGTEVVQNTYLGWATLSSGLQVEVVQ